MSRRILFTLFALALVPALRADDEEKAGPNDNKPPEGFVALFNGQNLDGWQGLVEIHKRAKDPEAYKKQVEEASKKGLPHWTAPCCWLVLAPLTSPPVQLSPFASTMRPTTTPPQYVEFG